MAQHAPHSSRRHRGDARTQAHTQQAHAHDRQLEHGQIVNGPGLVDRLRLVVFPVITGVTGRERIYDGYADFMLDMVNSQTFDGRLQLLEYVPTPLAGTRGTA